MTLVCAHRGEPWGHLENTLPALAAAVDGGADVVELDVRVTADGVPVVLHDATTARIWGVPVPVAEQTWAQVAELRNAGERILRLEEALDLFAEGRARVLVDVTSAEIALAAHEVVSRHPAAAHASWCGALEAMRAVRALDEDAVVYLAAEEAGDDLARLVDELRPAFLNCDGSEVGLDDLARARGLGLAVSVWTIDDAWAMRVLLDLGVDSITTNRPDLLRAVMAAPPAPAGDTEPLRELLRARDVAVELAQWAVRRARSGAATVDTKAHGADLVTDVDRDVESRVREVLAEAFPEDSVVGEEQGGRASGRTWFCDPVDGTTNFANGVPFASFSLALSVAGRPVVGVVADLARGEIVDAVSGGGVRLDALPVAPAAAPLAGGVVLTELYGNRAWPGMDELRERCVAADATLRIMGSGALSITQVALGRAAGCVIDAYHDVDHAAAVCIAAEAGRPVVGALQEPGPLRVGTVPGD